MDGLFFSPFFEITFASFLLVCFNEFTSFGNTSSIQDSYTLPKKQKKKNQMNGPAQRKSRKDAGRIFPLPPTFNLTQDSKYHLPHIKKMTRTTNHLKHSGKKKSEKKDDPTLTSVQHNRAPLLEELLVRSGERKSVAIDQDDGSHYYEARSLADAMVQFLYIGVVLCAVGGGLPYSALNCSNVSLSFGDALRRVLWFSVQLASPRCWWVEGRVGELYAFALLLCSSIEQSINSLQSVRLLLVDGVG